jgi:hypothetical protein
MPGRLVFFTTADGAASSTERMRIPATGGLQVVNCVSVGNATPSTSGAGITFPATQSASTNANTLDDYEEGTFTPSFIDNTGATITPSGGTAQGAYTKIGRLAWIRIHVYAVSNLSNIRRMQNLPFPIAGTTDYGGGGVVAGQHGASGGQSNASIPTLSLVRDGTPNGIQFNADYSFPSSGVNVDICFMYETSTS